MWTLFTNKECCVVNINMDRALYGIGTGDMDACLANVAALLKMHRVNAGHQPGACFILACIE